MKFKVFFGGLANHLAVGFRVLIENRTPLRGEDQLFLFALQAIDDALFMLCSGPLLTANPSTSVRDRSKTTTPEPTTFFWKRHVPVIGGEGGNR